VVNLTRNRHRHLRVVRMRTPAAVAEGSSEQAAILREDHLVFRDAAGRQVTVLVALGYAHADVARVVLRAGGRQLASAATAAAGWPGSSLRLWHARMPLTMQQLGTDRAVITATAYDAAGHVLGQVPLGRMS
jgi:hypothetical protein